MRSRGSTRSRGSLRRTRCTSSPTSCSAAHHLHPRRHDRVRDATGAPIEPASFRSDLHRTCPTRARASRQTPALRRRTGNRLHDPERHVAAGTVFAEIEASTPAAANFVIGTGGERTVFPLAASLDPLLAPDRDGADLPGLADRNSVPLPLPRQRQHRRVRRLRLTRLRDRVEGNPSLRHRTGVVQGTNRLYFNLFLPAGTAPAAGWPVAIYGHGFTDNKNGTR